MYGTLRRGSDNQHARMLFEHGQFVGEASIPGLLFDFGPYPGARPGTGSIKGEIFRIDESLLAAFDEYEGDEYERVMIAIEGLPDCWIYWYTGPKTGPRIAAGDWLRR